MTTTLFGRKLGMTRVFNDQGVLVPVTVLEVGPCVVTQIRTPEKDGYAAVQVGYDDLKPRNSTIPMIGHDAKAGTEAKRLHGEFKINAGKIGEYTLGQTLKISDLGGVTYVDVVGTSKGKGFQGTMKRHGFKGLFASHGTERKHRSPGSIGGLCSNRGFGGGLKKGKRMAGHMGDVRVTARSLDVVRVVEDRNLILVKGAVPGANNGFVMVRPAVRLNRAKTKKVAAKK
ncbi:MAG: 50S ribosomal protein L3 [Phycisphaeraceae bacterium]|nr:50S ribosomal protein L3 [Phycisphaeraceae bacterium]